MLDIFPSLTLLLRQFHALAAESASPVTELMEFKKLFRKLLRWVLWIIPCDHYIVLRRSIFQMSFLFQCFEDHKQFFFFNGLKKDFKTSTTDVFGTGAYSKWLSLAIWAGALDLPSRVSEKHVQQFGWI